MFNVGDRVIGAGIESGVDITGLVGTVVQASVFNCGVYFDEFNDYFHDLGGEAPRGHGWYCKHEVLAPYDDCHPYDDCQEYPDAPNVIELL